MIIDTRANCISAIPGNVEIEPQRQGTKNMEISSPSFVCKGCYTESLWEQRLCPGDWDYPEHEQENKWPLGNLTPLEERQRELSPIRDAWHWNYCCLLRQRWTDEGFREEYCNKIQGRTQRDFGRGSQNSAGGLGELRGGGALWDPQWGPGQISKLMLFRGLEHLSQCLLYKNPCYSRYLFTTEGRACTR